VARFDRYLLAQFLVLFGFFSLILVSVYWFNRAIGLFDRLLSDGQSARVFFEFTALTLPNVILIVVPVSAFAAVLYVTNRMIGGSEMIVVQTAGFASQRLVRGALIFGVIVALFIAVLAHGLVPLSRTRLSTRSAEVARDASAKFLKAGQFLHPGSGVTLYIRRITERGELRDVFLQDRRDPKASVTYTAQRALIVTAPASGPKLVMFNGMAQTLDAGTKALSVVTFADFAYDISHLIDQQVARQRDLRELSTPSLLHPSAGDLAATHATRAEFLYQAHQRFAQSLMALSLPVIAMATLLIGSFSRFGVWRQIIASVALLISLKIVESAVQERVQADARLWPLVYLPALLAMLMALALLWRANRRALFIRRRGRAT